MRFSSSSTLSVGATQFARLGICPSDCDCDALPFVRFCRKSKPGTNLPKPTFWLSFMATLSEVVVATAYPKRMAVRGRESVFVVSCRTADSGSGRLRQHGQI